MYVLQKILIGFHLIGMIFFLLFQSVLQLYHHCRWSIERVMTSAKSFSTLANKSSFSFNVPSWSLTLVRQMFVSVFIYSKFYSGYAFLSKKVMQTLFTLSVVIIVGSLIYLRETKPDNQNTPSNPKVWSVWELQILIVISLFLQMVLIFFNMRMTYIVYKSLNWYSISKICKNFIPMKYIEALKHILNAHNIDLLNVKVFVMHGWKNRKNIVIELETY